MYITVTLKQIKTALKTFDKTRFYSFKAFPLPGNRREALRVRPSAQAYDR